MTAQEISEMHLHSIGSSWDVFPAQDKTVNDIDLKKVARYIKEANANGRRKIEYKELAKTSKPTATRDLAELVQKKIFIIKGQGKRALFYMLYKSKESQ